jgi:hypothetical protein
MMPALRPSIYAITELTKRHITLPLAHIKAWKPFQIDALGLVTLLGTDEVGQSIGTLQRRRYTEHLPLLAIFVVAGDRFLTQQPGFVLYNLTDGITTSVMRGWATRWLMSQCVNDANTVLEWKKVERPRSWKDSIAPALSCVLVLPLPILSILVGDWFGVSNAVAIIISILTRAYILSQRRLARDAAVAFPGKEDHSSWKTLCIIRSDDRMITCKMPSSVLQTFVRGGQVRHPKFYHCARWLCWLALGVHISTLGMCSLVVQVYIVILLVFSTWLLTSGFHWDTGREEEMNINKDGSTVYSLRFSRDWCVEQVNHPTRTTDHRSCDKRRWAWARLDLGEEEERAMFRWGLFPDENKNFGWESEYQILKKHFRQHSLMKKPLGKDERHSVAPTAQAGLLRPVASGTLSTTPSIGGDSLSTSFGPSYNPSLASGISRASSPGNTQTIEMDVRKVDPDSFV